jgi:hypothetical protein
MKTALLSLILCIISLSALSQVPQGFNYQAIARDVSGNPIVGQIIKVKLSILSDSNGFYFGTIDPSKYIWEEEHANIKTNAFGMFTIELGKTPATKVQGSASSFSTINWSQAPLYIGTKIANPTTYKILGSAKLLSVPYSLMAARADSAKALLKGSKIAVVSGNDLDTNALFQVKRKDGQTVFAVYPNAVNVFVPTGAKGNKGGFAIGGFGGTKAGSQDYFRVTPDSVRIYIDNTPPPGKSGTKGGFAIGGFDGTKGSILPNYYMNITGSNSVNTVDSASQVLWYPNKQAFLAGRISIVSADSVGTNSTALGYKSRAIGNYSQAFGYRTTARGDYSTAIGKLSVAGSRAGGVSTASNAFALGNATKATGNDSYAFGSGAEASGLRSFAFGSVGIDTTGTPTSTITKASGNYSTALGMGAQATSLASMALGVGTTASGFATSTLGYGSNASKDYAVAIGFKAIASGTYSTAIGYYSVASMDRAYAFGYRSAATGNYSAAIGPFARTYSDYSSAFGRSASATGTSSVAVGYGASTNANDANAFGRSASASGATSVAIGYGATTTVSGTEASAFGKNSTASGAASMAIGVSAVASGGFSSAMGYGPTSSGQYSTAIGYGSIASGLYSTAVGYQAQATGSQSISIGAYYNYTYYKLEYNFLTRKFTMTPVPVTRYNTATDDYSIALGNGNTVTKGGFGIGSNNYARAIGAVALGHTNYADSAYSFAAGANNHARGYNAFALGESVTAEAANSFVIGYNNVTSGGYTRDEWVLTDPLFVIGNGGSGSQSNAMLVQKNGNTTIYGNLTVTGSIGGTVPAGSVVWNSIATQNIRLNNWWLSNDGGNEGVFVSTGGLVGINDNTPSYTLDVNGSMRATSSLVASSNFYSYGQMYGYGNLYMSGGIYGTTINPDNNANLTVDAGTLHIDGTNNRVGINNTVPSYSLDIAGNMYVSSTGRFGGDVTLASGSPAFYFTDTDLNDDDFLFGAHADVLAITTQGKYPTTIMTMTSAGVVGMPVVYSSTVGATNRDLYIDNTGKLGYVSSSLRYKKNIEDINDISWLYNLRPVTYQYKTQTTGERQYGLIAEEVLKVNPGFVSLNEKGTPETVSYSNLITPLLKAVQDQKKTIESLKSENELLRERLDRLESIVSSMAQGQK